MGSAIENRVVVLVVEDEPLLRMAAMDFIEEAGYSALEAANSAEALELLESFPHISILFTDVDMPGAMNGLRLAREVQERWPHIHIFISSGHREVTERDCPEGAQYFPKPLNEPKMREAMRSRLG